MDKQQQYLKERYHRGLQRKLESLPTNLSAEEKESALKQSLDAMMAYDRQAMRKSTLQKISKLQRKKIKVVDQVLRTQDTNKITRIVGWLRQLGRKNNTTAI